jgi:hypothetical protein
MRGVVIDTAAVAAAFELGTGAAPDSVDKALERHTRGQLRRQGGFAGRQRFEGGAHIGVPCALVARECARIAANVREMRRQAFEQTHIS